jgi:hypothetical protein
MTKIFYDHLIIIEEITPDGGDLNAGYGKETYG